MRMSTNDLNNGQSIHLSVANKRSWIFSMLKESHKERSFDVDSNISIKPRWAFLIEYSH